MRVIYKVEKGKWFNSGVHLFDNHKKLFYQIYGLACLPFSTLVLSNLDRLSLLLF